MELRFKTTIHPQYLTLTFHLPKAWRLPALALSVNPLWCCPLAHGLPFWSFGFGVTAIDILEPEVTPPEVTPWYQLVYRVCFAPNWSIIYKINITLYWRRLETSDWEPKLVMKLFAEVINQLRSWVGPGNSVNVLYNRWFQGFGFVPYGCCLGVANKWPNLQHNSWDLSRFSNCLILLGNYSKGR